MIPTVTLINAWPAAMDLKLAASYLAVSDGQLRKLIRTYPTRLRTMNLLPGGEAMVSRETLDKFIAWREMLGYEAKTA